MKNSNDIFYTYMLKQERWYQIIKPITAIMKFRLSWKNRKTEYLAGDLYFHAWNGCHSTETRLVPNGKKNI